MPTTCGFPNCKFRSRYRGQEDNRHFYRIPKRPAILRQAWLNAIGRSEETVVSQLRICSAHFYGGEKHEGDIPVADPQVDPPEFIELPPKESRTSERRSRLKGPPSSSSTSSSSLLLSPADRAAQLPSILRPTRRPHRGLFGGSPYGRFGPIASMAPLAAFGHKRQAADIGTIFGNFGAATKVGENCGKSAGPPASSFSSSSASSSSILPHQNCASALSDPFAASHFPLFASLFGAGKMPPLHPILLKNASPSSASLPPCQLSGGQRPLVALLDGRDCSIEMPLLKDIATVAFCDAQSISDVHEKVLNEATAALVYQSIHLGREELLKFKALKVVVRIGANMQNVDMQAATELGIAICHTPVECVEETADSTICLILNMFRRTFWTGQANGQMGKNPANIEQLREMMAGSKRIRGSTLGLVGMGRVGTAVALRAKSFGFRVLFHDPHLPSGLENSLGLGRSSSSLADLLAQSDCLSLHCPLTPETRHIINGESIKSLKFGAFVVNIGESQLVEPNALLAALKNGQLRAAALDQQRGAAEEAGGGGGGGIYDSLCAMPNVICTGQTGWYSPDSHRELREAASQVVRQALTGTIPEDLKHCVNKGELLALKRLFAIDKFSSTTNPTGAQLFASSLFPQLPMLNGKNAPGEIGHSISQITGSPTSNEAAASLQSSPLANYPPGLLMMHPQLWQIALLHSQQQQQQSGQAATNIFKAAQNSASNPEEDEDEAKKEEGEEEERGEMDGKDNLEKGNIRKKEEDGEEEEETEMEEDDATDNEKEKEEEERAKEEQRNVTPEFTVDTKNT